MNVVGLSGSPSAKSRSAWLLQFAQARLNAQRRGEAATIALRELAAQALVHGDAQHPALREAIGRIATIRDFRHVPYIAHEAVLVLAA